ncbi:L,D-transpeptidase [Dechloromonas sp. HYN0024]|uniref:L,D-transpeptidase family protein n=1 Tax=Dechloromonas sp. HYN0024 TaxID=2231055 RepID=UPI000E4390D0|nr:L,D-transpeptidase family protein [Dechloromonas sp. HYN0024]AXS80603.1 hypothetical protein HYN24_11580 [Dechloromonas sp. HYN0024]
MQPAPLGVTRQLLVVVAPSWGSPAGQLQRYERAGKEASWHACSAMVAVSLGRAGLAWGRGLHPLVGSGGPEKREGDGCAPAGIFAITSLFGYAPADSTFARSAKLPYQSATLDLKAIDDPASVHYNRIVDVSAVASPDWVSCEDMLRDDGRYAVGAVVGHNAEPPAAGAGSCIFLHVWERAGVPTAGCTAMALADMTAIAGWLDASAMPLLVQLPKAEYESLCAVWDLPACAA